MREDYRCDIRTGPHLSQLQAEVSALKDNDTIRTIVTMACNSTDRSCSKNRIHMGNYGRHNFNGGGPSGPYPPPKTSSGCVVSLPGCVSQAVHADTPHLFDEFQNRPHYVNAFYCTEEGGGGMEKGQTAFAVGSHILEVCKEMTEGGEEGRKFMER
jgi:hypothetical protein